MAREPPMPALRAVPVTLTAAERMILKKRVRGAKTAWRDRQRAQIVLLAARRWPTAAIASSLSIAEDTARKWRRRFPPRRLDRPAQAPPLPGPPPPPAPAGARPGGPRRARLPAQRRPGLAGRPGRARRAGARRRHPAHHRDRPLHGADGGCHGPGALPKRPPGVRHRGQRLRSPRQESGPAATPRPPERHHDPYPRPRARAEPDATRLLH